MNRRLFAVIALMIGAGLAAGTGRGTGAPPRLDALLLARAHAPRGISRVIVRTTQPESIDTLIRSVGGTPVRTLDRHSRVAAVPDVALATLGADPIVLSVSSDRLVTAVATAARTAVAAPPRQGGTRGVDGRGVGIATIDSGITPVHDDLDAARVVHWMDFVGHLTVPYDDYGHGTHVAGIVAGGGDPGGHRGIAPGADLIVLKALDATGNGRTSDVIAAVDYAVENRERFNIRVINLSVAAGVYESAQTDPLAQAALRAVRAGIVVVAAAGNFGLGPAGEPLYGSIAAPGNAPWVLTVGATDDRGTPDPGDDVIASFSSRGPSAIDGTPKPDLVAPGVGVEAMADPASTLFAIQPRARVWGTARAINRPYLRLSGTSMAAPLVTGTVALMVQAAPQLTPNAVKAVLQFTALPRPGADLSTQGTGVLNPDGAVALARELANGPAGAPASPEGAAWSRQFVWGAQRVRADTLQPSLAWDLDVTWGAETTPHGDLVTWESPCAPARAGCGSLR